MITAYQSTNYKAGVNSGLPRWDITFSEADFQAVVAGAWIEGPFSLQIDVDASTLDYPILIGVELQGISGTISIADRTHIAFISRERRVVTSASVPQLAYIDGIYNKIIVHCYGFLTTDATKCKVSLRLGPHAIISAPQEMIGRDTMAFDPGTYFSNGGLSNLIIAANSTGTSLFSINVNTLSAIRFKFVTIQLFLYPTPSFAGDIEAHLQVLNRASTIYTIARIASKRDEMVTYSYPGSLTLDAGYTLQCLVDNYNPAVQYKLGHNVTYLEVY